MKQILPILFMAIFLGSCIPLRIAPTIKDYKLTQGKRFKKGLPKKSVFVFEDPKEANEFYEYINTKFQLNDYYVDVQVPFTVEDEFFYFSFYEVEIPTKTINLIPMVLDVALNKSADMDPILEEAYSSRIGNWYIAIEVFNDIDKDCLSENSVSREMVLSYLRELKNEYLATDNYNEVVFKN
ncbi:MAG: hypothetical protein VX772_01575 [Bacteroidota bacterium]|uniref:Lipoprotein n=1 Tax=Flagellimonas okinawensis TaxID=3031324 RepID=A0ABT5XLX4_9FLAO|nr:hypothetical protein [[Muricauda] okinawensis]MDF0706898.1 hypothetical protein [[Muricauda] okinawensis]MEC8831021.1 hypothetical protein [Bacteroidota bacterium]